MKRRTLVASAAALGSGLLSACAGPRISDFSGERPRLDLRRYFDGTVDAYGVFTDRFGQVRKRFTVVMQCSWQGEAGREQGVLDEDFLYSDGSRQKRIWRLQREPGSQGQGRYRGRADDVVGEALGEEQGNAFYWTYVLNLPVDGRNYEVRFDDWMYLMDERVMLNRATMSKWGLTLGEVTLSFVPARAMSLNPVLRDWAGRGVWVVGASSGIGQAVASALHARGARVHVSARKAEALQHWVRQHPGQDAQGRACAQAWPLDVSDAGAVRSVAERIGADGPLDLVLYCAGHYRAQRATAFDLADMLRHQQINYVGALLVLDAVLPLLRRQGHGHLSLVSSVAGYRGLPQGLAYGPTKAALINLAETLYLDLHAQGLGVSLVNPGFVETPLTAQNEFRMPALISAEQAAQAMLRGWARGDFEIHFPRRFTWAMQALRLLPYRLYFPLVRKFTGL